MDRNDSAPRQPRAVDRSVLHGLRERQKSDAWQKIDGDPPVRIMINEVLRLIIMRTSGFTDYRFCSSRGSERLQPPRLAFRLALGICKRHRNSAAH